MKILKYLLIFVPISFIAKLMGASDTWMFILSCLSIIPLAGLMGEATEEISFYSGPKIGGFLNGTFGNATELIISFFALKQGLFEGKLESARSFLDILDDDTIATKLNIDVDIIKKLRIEKLKK